MLPLLDQIVPEAMTQEVAAIAQAGRRILPTAHQVAHLLAKVAHRGIAEALLLQARLQVVIQEAQDKLI
jgi:hypothetical protein